MHPQDGGPGGKEEGGPRDSREPGQSSPRPQHKPVLWREQLRCERASGRVCAGALRPRTAWECGACARCGWGGFPAASGRREAQGRCPGGRGEGELMEVVRVLRCPERV